jgi:hypothetical protein
VLQVCLPFILLLQGTSDQVHVCSALLLLDPNLAAPDGRYVVQDQKNGRAITIREEVVRATADIWGIFLARMSLQSLLQKVSPQVLHVVYTAASIAARKGWESGDMDAMKASEVLRRALRVMDGRWRAAGM